MNFDELINRRGTGSMKWSLFDEDVLPLWVADMDFRCPQVVLDAINERVSHGILGYDLPPAELSEVIVSRMDDLYGWKIESGDICYVPGCVTGFNLALRAMCEPGDAMIVQTPVYGPFLSAPANFGLKRIDNLLIEQEGERYEVDFDVFEEQIITNQVKLFLLCNPHNPVGRVFLREELLRMAEICLAHDVVICSDEIHSDLLFSGYQHIPIASLTAPIAEKTITLIAPSKTFNIAGLHASVVIVQNEAIKEKMKLARKGLVSNPSSLSLTAALAAYRQGGEWLKQCLSYMEANREWLLDAIKRQLPGIKMFAPEGTYLGWMDCRDLDLPIDPFHFFLEKARVGLNDGLEFGEAGKGFVRINFGTPRALLQEAVDRMEAALKSDGSDR